MDKNNQQQFNQFLSYSSGQKEACLVIAKDEKELKEFIKVLEKEEFKNQEDIFSLLEAIKVKSNNYFVVGGDEKGYKNIYDFIVQYPMNQIQMLNPDNNRKAIVSPNYQDLSVIFLITKDNLAKIQKQGFNILDKAGIIFQS